MTFEVGVDVGGTFTDLALTDGERLVVAKVPSTPRDQARGVLHGLEQLGADPGRLRRFAHGTTVATNAALERRGARTVLVTTEGFRDLLEIGRQNRPSLYDLFRDRTPPVIPRDLVVEAPERVAADGTVLRPLDADAVAVVAREVAALRPEAVALCLLFSFLRPEHEAAIAATLRATGLPVSVSSEVLPVFREYERASTTALDAYVAPALSRYLRSLDGALRDAGLGCEVEVMRSGGGTFGATTAASNPVHTLLSGPAAGAWGAAAVGLGCGVTDLIAFDMGGTSTDATLIEGGRPRTTAEGQVAGLPFAVPSTEIHTVGAGGGSVAWGDAGGALRVGPRSAGADPGPACYGKGGTDPTVTDAYLLLGLLHPDAPLGGSLRLEPAPATDALERLAASLGLETQAAAAGVVRVVEAHIAKALRVVSVERGRDPRRLALLAFGGAGPLHQGALARELGCPLVIVPRYPGVLSALGLLAAPRSASGARTVLRELNAEVASGLAAGWAGLEADVRASMDDAVVVRSADCRYRGQSFELEVMAPDDGDTTSGLARAFHDAHRERYGYALPEEAIEVVNLRVRAEAPRPVFALPSVPPGRGSAEARRGERTVRIEGRDTACAVFERDALGAGDRLHGPTIVAGVDATCLLLPGQHAEVDGVGNLLIRDA